MPQSEIFCLFNIINRYHINISRAGNAVDTLRNVKESHRAISNNGWPYFTSCYYNSDGRRVDSDYKEMELPFNYLGVKERATEATGVLRPATNFTNSMPVPRSDCPRMALFEITALVQDGELEFSLVWCKNTKRQDEIAAWARQLEQSLILMAKTLPTLGRSITLSDFALLPLTAETLESILRATKQQTGLDDPKIEAAYPCTPVEEGILLSQMKDGSHYSIQFA